MNEYPTVGEKLMPFSWLPNYIVNDPRFSMEVIAVALYLNGKPAGWVPRPVDIQKRFGIGPDRWRVISKLMRELGLIHERRIQGGRQLIFQIRCSMQSVDKPVLTTCGGVDTIGESHNMGKPNVGKPNVGKSPPIQRKRSTKKDILKIHDHEIEKNEQENKPRRPAKPPMSVRIALLTTDQFYMYEKLASFPGMFAGTAIGIVERHSVGLINNMLEVAIREGVKNPGSYVVTCLRKEEEKTTVGATGT